MEVILRDDVPGLGIIGEVVKVKPGYARNYLLPRGLAVPADPRNMKQLEHEKRIIAAKKARERGSYEQLATRLGGVAIAIEARAGKGGKLFGSVTNLDVHRLLVQQGFEVDRRRIELRDPIKEIGEFAVRVRVGQDITTTIKVLVSPQGGELEDASVDGDEEPTEALPSRSDSAQDVGAAEDADGPDHAG